MARPTLRPYLDNYLRAPRGDKTSEAGERVEAMFARWREDIQAIRARDPAARSGLEVAICYPGLHALAWHRLSHGLWRHGWIVTAHFLSNLERFATGIEIHPGARIGRRVFIDHGSGAVIGETAEVGDDVTLYQGVTLGGVAAVEGKRYPTVESGVIVGAGSQVLGPITVGSGARIGANAVVVKDVPGNATVAGIPALEIGAPDDGHSFHPYGLCGREGSDPLAATLERMEGELAALRSRLANLEDGAAQTGDGANRSEAERSQATSEAARPAHAFSRRARHHG